MMKQTQKIALSGLMTALAAVVLILSNIVPIGLYTFPAAAGIIIYILSFTVGRSYAWASYGAVSLLSLFLCADREASLCFVCFLGFYPLLKELLEKLPKVLAYAAKVLLFNAAAVSVYCLVIFVFSLPEESFNIFGIHLPAVFLTILNVIFLLYDCAVTIFFRTYGNKINNFVTKFTGRF